MQHPRPAGPPRATPEVRRYAELHNVDLNTIGLVTDPGGQISEWDIDLQLAAVAQTAVAAADLRGTP